MRGRRARRCATRIPRSCTCSGSTRVTSARTRPRFASPRRSPAPGPRPGRRWSRRRGWWRRGAAWSRWTSRALAAVNAVDGVTVFTVPDGLHVDAGRTLAGVKVTPLAIDEWSLEQAERAALSAADGAGILSVRPFLPLRVAAIVRQQLTDEARDAFRAIARHAQRLVRRHHRAGAVRRRQTPTQVQQALVDAAAYGGHRPRRRRCVGRSARRHLAEPARRRGDLDPAWPADAPGKQLLDRRAAGQAGDRGGLVRHVLAPERARPAHRPAPRRAATRCRLPRVARPRRPARQGGRAGGYLPTRPPSATIADED